MRFALIGLLLLNACTSIRFPDEGSMWPETPVPPWAARERFMITDNRSDTLSIVSATGPIERLASVPIGNVPVELEGPHHISASPDGLFVYVNLSNYVPGSGSGPHGSH